MMLLFSNRRLGGVRDTRSQNLLRDAGHKVIPQGEKVTCRICVI